MSLSSRLPGAGRIPVCATEPWRCLGTFAASQLGELIVVVFVFVFVTFSTRHMSWEMSWEPWHTDWLPVYGAHLVVCSSVLADPTRMITVFSSHDRCVPALGSRGNVRSGRLEPSLASDRVLPVSSRTEDMTDTPRVGLGLCYCTSNGSVFSVNLSVISLRCTR